MATKIVLFLTIGTAVGMKATYLTSILPCPAAGISGPTPITITEQYQPVSTCLPRPVIICNTPAERYTNASSRTPSKNDISTCISRFSYSTFLFVSTQVPCSYNVSSHLSTIITETEQLVTISHHRKTVPVEVPITSAITTSVLQPLQERRSSDAVTTLYKTVYEDVIVPYKNICDWAMPGYQGSGLDSECDRLYGDSERHQVVTIRKCNKRRHLRCVQYNETWISRPALSTTAVMTRTCSTSLFVASAGIYHFSFKQEPKTALFTISGWTKSMVIGGNPSVMVQPASTVTATHMMNEVIITKTCTRPTKLDFMSIVATTVAITVSVPTRTVRPSLTTTITMSGSLDISDSPITTRILSTDDRVDVDNPVSTFTPSRIRTGASSTSKLRSVTSYQFESMDSSLQFPTQPGNGGAIGVGGPVSTQIVSGSSTYVETSIIASTTRDSKFPLTGSPTSISAITGPEIAGDSLVGSMSTSFDTSPLSSTFSRASTSPITALLNTTNAMALPTTAVTITTQATSITERPVDISSTIGIRTSTSLILSDFASTTAISSTIAAITPNDSTTIVSNSNFVGTISSLTTTPSDQDSIGTSTTCFGLLCVEVSVGIPSINESADMVTLLPGQDTSTSSAAPGLSINAPTISNTLVTTPRTLTTFPPIPTSSTPCFGLLCVDVSVPLPGDNVKISTTSVPDANPTPGFPVLSLTPMITSLIDVTTTIPSIASTTLIILTITSDLTTNILESLTSSLTIKTINSDIPPMSVTPITVPTSTLSLFSSTFCNGLICVDISPSMSIDSQNVVGTTVIPDQGMLDDIATSVTTLVMTSTVEFTITTPSPALPLASTVLDLSTSCNALVCVEVSATLPSLTDGIGTSLLPEDNLFSGIPTVSSVPTLVSAITTSPLLPIVSASSGPSTLCNGVLCAELPTSLSVTTENIDITTFPGLITSTTLTTFNLITTPELGTIITTFVPTSLPISIDVSSSCDGLSCVEISASLAPVGNSDVGVTIPPAQDSSLSLSNTPIVPPMSTTSIVLPTSITSILLASTSCNGLLCVDISTSLPFVNTIDVEATILPDQDSLLSSSPLLSITTMSPELPTSSTLNTGISTSCDGVACIEISTTLPVVSAVNAGATLLPGFETSTTPGTLLSAPSLTLPDASTIITTSFQATDNVPISLDVSTSCSGLVCVEVSASIPAIGTADGSVTVLPQQTIDTSGIVVVTTAPSLISTLAGTPTLSTTCSGLNCVQISASDLPTTVPTPPDILTGTTCTGVLCLGVSADASDASTAALSGALLPGKNGLTTSTSSLSSSRPSTEVISNDIVATISCNRLVCVSVSAGTATTGTATTGINVGDTLLSTQDSTTSSITSNSIFESLSTDIPYTTLVTSTRAASSCNGLVCVSVSIDTSSKTTSVGATALSGATTSTSQVVDELTTSIAVTLSGTPICQGFLCASASVELGGTGIGISGTILPSQGSSGSTGSSSTTTVLPLTIPSTFLTSTLAFNPSSSLTSSTSCSGTLCISASVGTGGNGINAGVTLLPTSSSISSSIAMTTTIQVTSIPTLTLVTTTPSIIVTLTTTANSSSSSSTSCSGALCVSASTGIGGTGVNIGATVLPTSSNSAATTTSVTASTSTTSFPTTIAISSTVLTTTTTPLTIITTTRTTQTSIQTTTTSSRATSTSSTLVGTSTGPSCNGLICLSATVSVAGVNVGASATVLGTSSLVNVSAGTNTGSTPTTLVTSTTTRPAIGIPGITRV